MRSKTILIARTGTLATIGGGVWLASASAESARGETLTLIAQSTKLEHQ